MPQRGNATLQALALTAAFALVLGAIGPALDPSPYGDGGYEAARLESGQARQLEAEALRKCQLQHGDNAGVIIDARGAIVCTDKHGRRSRISTYVKVER